METLIQDWQTQLGVLATTAYAMLLGGAIGYEREMKNRPAGFRTHMLVAGAAALLVGLTDLLSQRFSGEGYRELITLDPIRLIEAMVAAVGFLGAGTIFRNSGGSVVSGITTAASLLMVAVIGIAAGLHSHVLAVGATALTLGVLVILGWTERRFDAARATSAD
ncbi:MAG: MgtC/SapB family protein [Arenimonas sp.]|uniref:MgtC/SapB family protein n=1 Tax=Arenimonas sp. TaxID=1872635 RepID=UPI0025BA6427|nr:MgtC/SapB family protein [Arenimonas sp.]MBW8366863.1 MgtC/SapB family protein [Arenimonas sp.]